MLVALWAGSYVLAFFGITLPALRCAGGIVLALYAWTSLNAPERREARKSEQLDAGVGALEDVAFYPLTLPFTTGTGHHIGRGGARLRASRPPGWRWCRSSWACQLAALAVAVLVWLLYSASDQLSRSARPGGQPRHHAAWRPSSSSASACRS